MAEAYGNEDDIASCGYSIEQLREAMRQIDSTLHKLRAARASLEAKPHRERLKSQITLATRRIEAFSLARDLMQRELDGRA